MNRAWGKLIVFAILLVLSVIACNITALTSVYDYGSIDEDLCISIGGKWVPEEDGGVCLEPTSQGTSVEEAQSQNESDLYLMKPCIADYDQYKWEFAKEIDEDRTETKHVCSGNLNLLNTSNDILDYKLYEIWDNGAMRQEGWDEGYYRLEPGKDFSLTFETQIWTDGRSTVATYTKIIVFRANSQCAALFSDAVYKDLWDMVAVPLGDPCR